MLVSNIRKQFRDLLSQDKLTPLSREGSMTNLVGNTTIEIVGASFIADEDAIFGVINWEYVEREEQWYNSMSLNVNDIPGGPPKIWSAVADKDGFINSNYGWTLYHPDNGSQYDQVVQELKSNPYSRRAMAIYTRPSMWEDYNKNGRSDFMCLAGDTIIKSPEGDLPIKDVVDKIKLLGKWPVWSVDFDKGERHLSWATDGFKNGVKELVRVHLDDGTHIDCTEDHIFFTQNKKGSTGKWTYGIEIEAGKLTPGTRLIDFLKCKNGNAEAYKQTLTGGFSFDTRKIIHRDYYSFVTGEDITGFHIHHKNEDPLDNSFCNLEKLTPSDHRKHHLQIDNPAWKYDKQNQVSKRIKTMKNQVSARDLTWYEQCNGVTLNEALIDAQEWFSDPHRASLRKYRVHCKKNNKNGFYTILNRASKLTDIHPLKMIYQNTKVVIVEKLNIKQDVYDLSVPGDNNFFVGNGVLVHNCTNTVQYVVRNDKLHAIVQMRSNDAIFGYKNDRAWQQHVLEKLGQELNIIPGKLYWQVGSLHIYARHYHLVK